MTSAVEGLRSPSEKKHYEIKGGAETVHRAPVSIAALTGIGAPPRIDLFNYRDKYRELAHMPLSVIALGEQPNGDQEYLAIATPPQALTANDLNSLLYFMSPITHNTMQTEFIIEHWRELRAKRHLLTAHETIPGWEAFEANGFAIFDLLERNFKNGGLIKNNNDTIIPAIHWVRRKDGTRTLLLDPLDDHAKDSIIHAVANVDTDKMNIAAGVAMVGAYEPEITTRMPTEVNYQPGTFKKNIPSQGLGIIQTLPYLFREITVLQESAPINSASLLQALETYVRTGETPPYDAYQAIRRTLLAVFQRNDLGIDLKRTQRYYPFRDENYFGYQDHLTVTTNAQIKIHTAITNPRRSDRFVVELHERYKATDPTKYVLEGATWGATNRMRLALDDYPDGTTVLTAFKGMDTSDWPMKPVEIDSKVKKQIEEVFGIKLP